MASSFTLCLSLPLPAKQHNNLRVLQALFLWRLVTAKYLPTNYPQVPFLSLQPGPHKKEQTITTVKAPQRKETHYNPGRHEGCGKKIVLMETELNLIKKQTKQTADKTQTLHTLCEWPRTKLICSYPSTPEEAGWKRQVFKRQLTIVTEGNVN